MNNKELKIRTIKKSDWKTYKEIRLRSLKDSPEAFCNTYEYARKESDQQWQDRCRIKSDQKALPLLAEVDGLVCGVAWGVIHRPEDTTANVYQMWVSPDARGLGLGRALLDSIVNWSRDQGMETVTLGVNTTNISAIALYQSMGFEVSDETEPMREDSDDRVQTMILTF
ncbi:MAG: GNAT family N-acetyltransferase [Endozoicomonas sp.]|uniref:GNAT family N-acetyltransferase n=1 Tax=Endozoicomonas sp. TaxID=1892382 RepID=UPI003D9B3A13